MSQPEEDEQRSEDRRIQIERVIPGAIFEYKGEPGWFVALKLADDGYHFIGSIDNEFPVEDIVYLVPGEMYTVLSVDLSAPVNRRNDNWNAVYTNLLSVMTGRVNCFRFDLEKFKEVG